MTQPIQPGDLVYVKAWPCCGYRLGQTFIVREVHTGLTFHCNNCGARSDDRLTVAWCGVREGPAARVEWLQRIDPLKEPETVERPEEVTA